MMLVALAKLTDFCCDIKMHIEAYLPHHLEAIIRICLQSWTQFFDGFQRFANANELQALDANQWQVSRQKEVEDICAAKDTNVWVSINEGSTVVGFVAIKLHSESNRGKICMVAVDQDFQGRGIAIALIEFALAQMKSAGMISDEICWDVYRNV